MGRRNADLEKLRRLECKTLDARFLNEVREGLGCSPFEAAAVLDVVREVYFPFLDEAKPMGPPGKVTLVAVDADEPAGKPVVDCEKRTVCLTVHRGAEDDKLLREGGPQAFRRARLVDICQEALSQGGLLTREDLAYRVFFVSPSTITRDVRALREADPQLVIPMRGTIHDMGPVLTHRVEIVRLALEGKTTTEICDITRHSSAAVANYVSTFTRCAQLAKRNMQASQIAFLLRRGRRLIEQYLELLATCGKKDKNRAYHLEELLRVGVGKKKAQREGNHGTSS
jgi:hypothetical protein